MEVKRKRSVLVLVFVFALVLCMVPLQIAAAADEILSAYDTSEQITPFNGDVVFVPGDFPTLSQAVTNTPVNGMRTIVLTENIIMTGHVGISQGRHITLIPDGNDITLYRTDNLTQRHFSIEQDATLVLDACPNGNTITLTREPSNTAIGGGIGITNGTFILNAGTISNNQAANGAGVNVTQGSTFIMNGGTISGNIANNNGGGVNVAGVATAPFNTFTMNGGTVSDNTANINGGGVSLGSNSTFTMQNGFIENNTANGANVNLGGGGVFMEGAGAQFHIHGGAIRGNNALRGGGVRIINGTFTMHDGEISGNLARFVSGSPSNGGGFGGGVMATNPGASFIMHQGEIINNTAEGASGQSGGGGGVFINSQASFTMHNGVISGNQATRGRGGGLFMEAVDTQFTMHNGAVIGNIAYLDGGGVSVANGIVTMSDGAISNNTATRDGGGMWLGTGTVTTGARLNMTGGTISGNAAVEGDGGGIFATATNTQAAPPVGVYPQIIAVGTISGNTAGGGRFALPTNADAITRGIGLLMDNYNINYRGSIRLFSVIFDLDGGVYGGEQALLTQTVPNGQGATALTANPTRPSYIFNGWLPALNLENVTENRTFVAQWTPLYTVIFDLAGGTYSGNQALLTQMVSDGQDATALTANPTRPGFTFDGWSPALNLEDVTGDRTFVAQWRPVQQPQPTPTLPGNGNGGDNGDNNGGDNSGDNGDNNSGDNDDNNRDDNGLFSPYHNSFLIGRPSGNIYPHDNILRAEVAAVFFRLLSDDTRIEMWSQENPFPDVNSPQWFNNEVSTVTNMEVIRGRPDGTFAPNQAITRAEVAAIVARFFDETSDNGTAFTDIAGHWAEDYINQLAHLGWVQGPGDGTFRPNQLITRAEFAAIINRMLNRVPESIDALLDGRTRWPDKTNQLAWYYLYLQEATHSTEFERLGNDYLRWTAILEHIDWSVFSRPDSRPDDILVSRGH